MVIGQLSLAPGPVDGAGDGVRQPSSGGDDVNKTARLPRWTRQEILVLIQGKRVAENRVRRGRGSGSAFGSGQIEPKWASVSSYCKRHGVNRGPVQCRKRWSNLAGDYKKIKEWESKIKEETDSFWVMRNDLRREKKLPGFFDKEVYDILDGGGGGGGVGGDMEEVGSGLDLALASKVEVEEGGEEADVEVLFDGGRSAAVDDGLFSEFDQSGSVPVKETPVKDIPAPIPISFSVATEKHHHQSFPQEEELPAEGTGEEKQPEVQEGRKRKRYSMEEEAAETNNTTYDFEARLIETLEKNGKLVSSQLEAQNTHLRLDREQRKEDANSFIAVLNKIADALGKIADKL